MDSTLSYSKIVERYARFFERPELRLRFLHGTLARQSEGRERADAVLGRFPRLKGTRLYEQLLKLWLYHLIFQELARLLPSATGERRRIKRLTHRAPIASRLLFRCYTLRRPLAAVGVLLLAVSFFGAYKGMAWSARRANSYLASFYGTSRAPGKQAAGAGTAYAQTPVPALPDYRPEKVWMVESGENFERYSNGARVLNDFETTNRPRGYYAFRNGKAQKDGGLLSAAVGIVYHTSENDMLPFTPDNSASIETRSRGLLEYVRRNKSYNYVIDRFGQIYRIVRDEDAAHHAGNSVWAGPAGTYVGLNDSFIGVCFESSMQTDEGVERLTEAQLVAGRLLTQVLRSRHQIDDANCVTHGLVSVNPSNMRICFHHDWAQGFPFEAMGLSDKYKVAPAAVSEFGFTYDDETLSKLGGALWPGVAAAEEAFARRASETRSEVEKLRREMREAYREGMELQRRERASSTSGDDGPGAAERQAE